MAQQYDCCKIHMLNVQKNVSNLSSDLQTHKPKFEGIEGVEVQLL
jgi:hypothetical protein